MNSRNLVNLSLLIFLIIFVAIYLGSRKIEVDSKHLTSLSLNEINKIEIHKNNNNIVFKKEDKGIWYMQNPYQIKAHQFRINTLLSLSQITLQESYNIDTLSLSDYALDTPRAHITFNETDVLFGKTNTINNKRYFLAENKMSLINDQTYPLVSAHASSFINLSLLDDGFQIIKIQTPVTTVQRDQNNLWQSSGKNILNADQVQSFLEHWKSAQAFAVHEIVEKPTIDTIVISSKNDTIVFHIKDNDPWLILSRPDLNIEYHLDKSMKNFLYGITEAKTDA